MEVQAMTLKEIRKTRWYKKSLAGLAGEPGRIAILDRAIRNANRSGVVLGFDLADYKEEICIECDGDSDDWYRLAKRMGWRIK